MSKANAEGPLPPSEASKLARGLGGGDRAAPASIACTVALAGRAPPSATAWTSAAAAATAATAPLLSSSEQAIKTTDFAVGLFDGSSTLALPLPCIYFFHSTLAKMGAMTKRL